MRLLWLSVNASYSHASLALPLLERACRHLPGWEWQQLELTLADRAEDAAIRMHAERPDLVCATLYLFNRNLVFDILHRLHLLLPACPIAVGGPECLGDGAVELLRSHPFLTACVRGEGETVMPHLLAAVAAGTPPPAITGLLCRGPDGTIVHPATPAAVSADWAASPPPAESPLFPAGKPFVQMETSRGCPHACSYCTSCRTPVRQKELAAVRHELGLLRARGCTNIRLLDRTFNLPQRRAAALLQMFRQEFPDLRFHLEIHPQHLGPALRQALAAAPAGQLHLEAGIQSRQDAVQNAIGRRADGAGVMAGLTFLCALPNLDVHTDLIAGLPQQTLAGLLDDLAALLGCGPTEIQLETLKMLPGTPLRRQAAALGLVYAPYPPYDILKTPSMSPDDIATARQLSRLLDLYANHPALHTPFLDAQRQNPGFVMNFLDHLRRQGIDLQMPSSLKRRFEHFADYCRERNPLTLDTLAYHWLKNGLPPEQCPSRQAFFGQAPATGLELCEGNPDALGLSGSRCCHLRSAAGDYLFVYHRTLVMNASAAIYRVRP